ncbi:hypothetical protein FD25_GL001883 [Levilactobacillus acidifarinae DSM 19394]|uniref:Uncharacterized protein n=2 Tax=Levilactobacillus acidifarinae TaxID=267364 RepID=A0A0R1LKQ7_9LACO|nr:hypothetical protein FD25_GL001883 [Levilactobacillus acidifarinae DSM 19394]
MSCTNAQQLSAILLALDHFHALWHDSASARHLREYTTLQAVTPRHHITQCRVWAQAQGYQAIDLPVVRFDDGEEVVILHYPAIALAQLTPTIATANATYVVTLVNELIRLVALDTRV